MRHQHTSTKAKKPAPPASMFGRENSNYFFTSASNLNEPFFRLNTIQSKPYKSSQENKIEQRTARVADGFIPSPVPPIQRQVARNIEEIKHSQSIKEGQKLQMHPIEESGLQLKCNACEEKENIQLQEHTSNIASAGITNKLRRTVGKGYSIEPGLQQDMSREFGSDFSNVKIHTDDSSTEINNELGARAFTHGSDIYFNRGEYRPESSTGKHLLAHELTHVIQQRSDLSSPIVNMKRKFTPGRPAHNHKPVGWAKIQWQALKNCDPRTSFGQIECACAISSDPFKALSLAIAGKMFNAPLARQHIMHYLFYGGSDYDENLNLKHLIEQDIGVRSKFARAIAISDRGNIPIWQGDYSLKDFRLAFGGIDRVDYEVSPLKGGFKSVDIWFKDRYDFHPVGFGYANKGTGDSLRNTNCIHAAAVEQKAYGATDFWMIGEATFPLSLFKSSKVDPHPGIY